MFVGLGTVTNVITVVIGSLLGLSFGHHIPERTKDLITTVLGLVTIVVGGLSVVSVRSPELLAAVGEGFPVLVVLGSLLIGALLGSWWRIEERLENLADAIRRKFVSQDESSNFVDGFVTATLLFCIGPLSILGSFSDGLGRGIEQLLVKSALDGVAAMAFASTFGIGVMLAAVPVAVYQGSLTVIGMVAGDFLPIAAIDAMGATGGVIIMGLGIRLLQIKAIPVGDLLPALLVAPMLVQAIVWIR